ncbi:MAG: ABC-2 family transporter protein [Clostridia bacterium]|nr:ABC-2 family transporter protein [Clostridia bacterium]
MRAYTSYFRLRLRSGLTYRTAAWAGVATQFFFGFLFLMIYDAFYRSGTGTQPISMPQLAVYVWLQQAFLSLIMLWFRDSELFGLILNGNVAYELCRPVDLYGFWYARLLAQRVAAAALRCVPLLAVAAVLPRPFRLGPPASVASFLGFLGTMLLGLLIVVTLTMLIYVLTFVTMSPAGTSQVFSVVAEFLSGGVIAIPLMPEGLQRAAYFLPFAYTADLPFRVYSGHIPSAEVPLLMLRQGAWAAVLAAAGYAALHRILRRVTVQGG